MVSRATPTWNKTSQETEGLELCSRLDQRKHNDFKSFGSLYCPRWCMQFSGCCGILLSWIGRSNRTIVGVLWAVHGHFTSSVVEITAEYFRYPGDRTISQPKYSRCWESSDAEKGRELRRAGAGSMSMIAKGTVPDTTTARRGKINEYLHIYWINTPARRLDYLWVYDILLSDRYINACRRHRADRLKIKVVLEYTFILEWK